MKITSVAEKQINDLGHVASVRIRKFMKERLAVSEEPRRLGHRLVDSDNIWRFRVGDYRILTKIEDTDILILVIAVGHRKDVYRDL